MELGRLLAEWTSEVATVPVGARVGEAAERMARTGVGSLVVVGEDGGPVGMLTDRDLTLRVVARAADPGAVSVGDVMSSPLLGVEAGETQDGVIALMKKWGVRRVPVLRNGRLVGIVALDDVVQSLARDMDDLSKETQSKLRLARIGQSEGVRRDVDAKLERAYRRLQRTNWITRDELLEQIDELRRQVSRAAYRSAKL